MKVSESFLMCPTNWILSVLWVQEAPFLDRSVGWDHFGTILEPTGSVALLRSSQAETLRPAFPRRPGQDLKSKSTQLFWVYRGI